MNSKHTAGPWKFTSGGGNAGPQLLGSKNGLDFIMDMGVDYHRKGEMPIEADRLLIEAAPEMLEALELALEHMQAMCKEVEGHPGEPYGPCPCIVIEALIKKAKGEPDVS